MLNQCATDLVGDAFRLAGGTRGVKHIERIVKLAWYKIDPGDRVSDDVSPVDRVDAVAESRQVYLDNMLDARQLGGDIFDLGAELVSLAVVKVTVHREQESRFSLAEAIDHAVFAKIG